MDGGMNIMTAIIDSQTLEIMYIGLMLLYSIYVIREKRIVLSAQKHFTIYFPMNYLELLLSAKVLTSLYELGLTLLTRYQPFLLPLFLLLN